MNDPRPDPAGLRSGGKCLPSTTEGGGDPAIAVLFTTAIGSATFVVRALCTGAAPSSLNDLVLAGLASAAGLVSLLYWPHSGQPR